MAAADLLAARGVFDTRVAATVDHRIDKSSQSVPAIFGTRTDRTRFNAEAAKTLPTGTETGVTFTNDRRKVGGAALTNPLEFETAVAATVKQPLLKNVGGIVDRRVVSQAREALKTADLGVQRKTQEALRSGLGHYWRSYFAQREIVIAQQAVATAREFLAITDERYRLGTADGSDLLAAKANVASREATVLGARTALEDALRGMKTELQIPVDDTVTATAAMPSTRHALPGTDTAIAGGLTNRPDYQAMQHRIDQMQLRVEMAKNKRWPTLDLVSSLAVNQIATTSYGDAIGGADNPNFLIGMQLQASLENRRARGERDRAQHEKARALIDYKSLENQIAHEIAERLSTLRLLATQVGAQEKAEGLQQSRLQIQREQYKLGRSSSLEVIKAQDDLLAARVATLRARHAHQQAWLDYQLATAQIP